MPIRHLTVTGLSVTSRMARTHSATSSGSAMRHAPKRPDCTRSDGQPTLRLISSQAIAGTVHDRGAGHHLGEQQRTARQDAMEVPTMPIGPVHHRCNAETPVYF